MKLKPLGNRILVKPKETEEKTTGGIYIPDSAKDKTQEGEVLAVGDGKEVNVKVGDLILHEKYAGTEITINGSKNLIMDIKDVLAVIHS